MLPGSQNHIILLKPALIRSCDSSGLACMFAALQCMLHVVNVPSWQRASTHGSLNFVRPLYLRLYIVIWGDVFFIFSYLILFHFVAFYIREEILLEHLIWAVIKSKTIKTYLGYKT